MRSIIALLFSFFALYQEVDANVLTAEGEYSVFLKNGKKGLGNDKGEVLIPAIYDDLGWSDNSSLPIDGVLGYKNDGKWGLISVSNKKILPPTYESLDRGVAGQIIASRKGKFSQTAFFGTINAKGNTLIPFIYYSLSSVDQIYLALVRKESRMRYGIVDGTGAQLLPFVFLHIRPYNDKLVVADAGDLLTLYNTDTKTTCLDSTNKLEPYLDGYSKVYKANLVGLINEKGEVVVPIEYRNVRIGEDGRAEAMKHSEWNVLDNDNIVITTLLGDDLELFGDKIKLGSPNHQVLYSNDYKQLTPSHFHNIANVVGNKIVFSQDQKFGIYDLDKGKAMNTKFDSLYLDGEFFYGFKANGKREYWSVYDTFAIKRSKFEYEGIRPYKNHLFAVKRRGHWGFMDRYGSEVIHCVYDSVGEITNDLISVVYHKNHGVINKIGDWVVLPQKDEIVMLSKETFLSYGQMTTTLEHINGELIYFTDNPIHLEDGLLMEELPDGKVRKLSTKGLILTENAMSITTYASRKYEDDEYVAVKINGSYGMVDKATGRLRITNRYQDVGRVREEVLPVKILGKWGIVDLNEKLIVQPIYDSIFQFENNKAIVISDGQWGIIDKSGKQILVPAFDELQYLPSGQYKSRKDDLFGLVDKNGRITINAKYESLEELANGHAIIQKGGKFGVVTQDGVNTIPQVYHSIVYDSQTNRYYAQTQKSWKSLNYEL